MNEKELKKILDLHLDWLKEEDGGKRADLQGANLGGADLRDADLRNADLQGANLQGADLWGASLRGVIGVDLACPSHGAFIGWKKAVTSEDGPVIIKLLIPDDAKRSSATLRKCRCDKAKVEEVYDYEFQYGELVLKPMAGIIAHSDYDEDFVYKKGEAVSVTDFCEDRWKECESGIHFFITPEEAARY